MWTIVKGVFYTLIAVLVVYAAIGIGTILAIIGAALGSLAIGGAVLLFVILMVKELFEGPSPPE
jgi:hypothetical protein